MHSHSATLLIGIWPAGTLLARGTLLIDPQSNFLMLLKVVLYITKASLRVPGRSTMSAMHSAVFVAGFSHFKFVLGCWTDSGRLSNLENLC